MKQMKRIETLTLLKAGMWKVRKRSNIFERNYRSFTALRQKHSSAPNCRPFLFRFCWLGPQPHYKICVVRNYKFSNFYALLTVDPSITLVNDQLDAQFFYYTIG